MNALTCIDYLAFGAEADDITDIAIVAKFLVSENAELDGLIREKLKLGLSYATAREQAVGELLGERHAKILREPNNILGVEYLKALQSLDSTIKPILVKRNAVGHNDITINDSFASASLIRKMIINDSLESVEKLVPQACMDIYRTAKTHTLQTVEMAILAGLRKSSPAEIAYITDVSEGLQNRIFSSAKDYNTLDGLLDAVKTKRYTHARLCRIMLRSFLGIEQDELILPRYLKILAFSPGGQEVLNSIKKTTILPLVKNFAQLKKLNRGKKPLIPGGCAVVESHDLDGAVQAWERELIFDSLYELCAR